MVHGKAILFSIPGSVVYWVGVAHIGVSDGIGRAQQYIHVAVMVSLSSSRVVLVTGANQGIGLEIVRQLSKRFDGVVLLAGTYRTIQKL